VPEADAVISSRSESGDMLSRDDAAPSPGEFANGNTPSRRWAGTGWKDDDGEETAVEPEDTGIVWFTPAAAGLEAARNSATTGRVPDPPGAADADRDGPQDSGITWFLQDGGQPLGSDAAGTASAAGASPAENADPTAALQPGAWVEIRGDSGDPVQARLSIVSPHRSTFVFSDRAGALVAEYSAYQVETYLRSGRLAVIPEAPLFERALGNLVGLLRRRAA